MSALSSPIAVLSRSGACGLAALLLVALAGCTPRQQAEGTACVFTDDCRHPLICAGRRCRAPCADDHDCVSPYRCRDTETRPVRVCLPPGEYGVCVFASDCGNTGLICRQGTCVQPCDSARLCPDGLVCSPFAYCIAPAASAGGDAGTTDGAVADGSTPGDASPDGPRTDAAPPDDATPTDGGGPLPAFSQLCAGAYRTCALATTGDVWCWGSNANGALGRGTTSPASSPVPAPVGVHGAQSLACSPLTTCATLADGSVSCWGGNQVNVAGQPGTTPVRALPAPMDAPVLRGLVAIGLNDLNGYGVDSAGREVTWGGYWPAALGRNGNPIPLAQVTVGQDHACLVAADYSAVFCIGSNADAQMGIGAASPNRSPSLIQVDYGPLAPGGFSVLTAGAHTTCGILGTGEARCWGNNRAGQAIGPGAALVLQPTVIPGIDRVQGIAVGGAAATPWTSHTCAIMQDRTVRCWGNNSAGQHGDGTTGGDGSPGAPVLSGVVALGAGYDHTCAIVTGGRVFCWGANAQGQLGQGSVSSTAMSPSPLEVRP